MGRLFDSGNGIIPEIPLIGECIDGSVLKDDLAGGVKFIVPAECKIGGGNRFVLITAIPGKHEAKERKPEALSFHLFCEYQYLVVQDFNHTAVDIKEKRYLTFIFDFDLSLF